MGFFGVLVLVAIAFYAGYELGKKSAEDKYQYIMALSSKKETKEEISSVPYSVPASVSKPITEVPSNPALFSHTHCTYNGIEGIEITGYNGFDESKVVIPEKINDLPVISIGERAFEKCCFNTVVLPSQLHQIRKYAFSGCESLQSIYIPSGVVSIEEYAFCDTSSLRSVNLPDGLTHLGENVFAGSGISSITFPASIMKVPNWCCSDCYNLQSVTIQEGIMEVGSWAFQISKEAYRYRKGKNLLTHVIIPKSVELVDSHAFEDRIPTLNQKGTVLAFQGVQTKMSDRVFGQINVHEENIVVYVLSGSEARKAARSKGFTVKPLSEFPYK